MRRWLPAAAAASAKRRRRAAKWMIVAVSDFNRELCETQASPSMAAPMDAASPHRVRRLARTVRREP